MTSYWSSIFRSVVITVLLFFSLAHCVESSDLRVDIVPRELFPGQAAMVQMESEMEITAVTAVLKKQQIQFYPEEDKRRWSGLFGLDLALTPQVHPLSYTVEFSNGSKYNGTYGLRIGKKDFPEERITVDRKYVHLSKEDLARYRREQKVLASIYRTQSPEPAWLEGFVVPVNVEKGSRFGLRRIINNEPRSPHSGADLKAGTGTPVAASCGGKVVFADDLFFSGNTVILDHGGGLYTLYSHLSKITSEKDTWVQKGEIIGQVGATGRVTGPHLHWGVKLNGTRVDPFSLVNLPLTPQKE